MPTPNLFWGSAGAGVLPYCPHTDRLLLNHRSSAVREPGTWGVWGGAIDLDENPKEAAKRELVEESGYVGNFTLVSGAVFSKGDFQYYNFLGVVPKEFIPRLDWESKGWKWATPEQLYDMHPIHFGLQYWMDNGLFHLIADL